MEETGKGPASESSEKKKGRTIAITTEDMQKRRNDVKARTTFLFALPDEYQLRFSKYETAKELWEAILKTFETLEQTFNGLQAIVSYLEFMDVEIEQDDLNQKFLTSLASEWLMYTIVWRNKDDLDTMSLDDVYNHLKVYEPEVKKKSESNCQNMAFISSSNTSNGKGKVHTASVPTASIQVSTASTDVAASSLSHDTICAYIATQSNRSQIKYEDVTQIDEDDIEEMDIKWNMALLSMRADRFWKKTSKKITIQGSDVAGFDKSKMECFNYHKMGHFVRECRAPRCQDRGKRESYKQADDEFPTEFALMSKSSSSLDNEVKKEKESLDDKLTGFKNASKDLDNLLESQRSDKNKEGLPEFVDDTVTDYSRPTPSIDASKCNKNELQSSNSSVFEHGESSGSIMSKPMIKFVKEADCPRDIKIINSENARKLTVKYAEMYRIISKVDESMLWYRRLGHLNFKTTNKLVRNNLVKGLPSKCFENDHTCVACLKRKQHKASYKTKCDNGGEFKNQEMNEFCTKKGIRRELSNARTPQQNGVAERRNRTLIEAARTILADAKLLVTFWAEAVNTACYVQNRVLVNKSQNKTPYELFNSRTPTIGFLRPFGCHVMILNTLDHSGKFDTKGDEGYFVGYSLTSKAFRVFNKRTKKVEENLNVDFLENKLIKKGASPNWLFVIDTLTNYMNYVPVVVVGTSSTNISGTKDVASQDVKKDVSSLRYIALPNWFHKAYMETSNAIIRNSDAPDDCNADVPESSGSPIPIVCLDITLEISSGSRLISKGVFSQKETPSLGNALTLSKRFEDTFGVEADLSNMETSIPEEPKKIFDALKDPSWVEAMQEELPQFKIQNVWVLVDCPKG
nr:ribonuclease H-like domain-containing protein [Tanacetum cinerariifolium]